MTAMTSVHPAPRTERVVHNSELTLGHCGKSPEGHTSLVFRRLAITLHPGVEPSHITICGLDSNEVDQAIPVQPGAEVAEAHRSCGHSHGSFSMTTCSKEPHAEHFLVTSGSTL